MAARWAHNPEVPGSSPGPATNNKKPPVQAVFCLEYYYLYLSHELTRLGSTVHTSPIRKEAGL